MLIKFAPSQRSTIGVEWELQLINPQTNALAECAPEVLAAVEKRHPKHGILHSEMLRNTVELVSRKRTTVAECAADMNEGLSLLEPVLDELGVELAGGGSHPFANPTHELVSEHPRYKELVERTQYWGRQMLIFGTHVHVGVEDQAKALPIARFLTTKIGLLQALTAASPFWDGIDTGYADNRAMMFQQLPTAGIPPELPTWESLEEYTDNMMQVGAIHHFDELRWDVRPAPHFGTVEARIADSSSNLAEVRALAALVHSLVEWASRELDAGRELPTLPHWYVEENKWRAARYGVGALLIDTDDGELVPMMLALPDLVEQLLPVAEDLDCAADLALAPELVSDGVGYVRQRLVSKRAGTLDAVVAHSRAELKAGTPIAPAHFVARQWRGSDDATRSEGSGHTPESGNPDKQSGDAQPHSTVLIPRSDAIDAQPHIRDAYLRTPGSHSSDLSLQLGGEQSAAASKATEKDRPEEWGAGAA